MGLLLTPRAVELFPELAHELSLGPGEPTVIHRDSEQPLFTPAVALDRLGISTRSAVASRVPLHATPPFVSIAQRRSAIASASLSSAGLKPRVRAAAIIVCFEALHLPVACR